MRFKLKNTDIMAVLLAKEYDRKLIMVLLWWMKEFGSMTVTEGWRKQRHPHDLHGTSPVRAIDLRSWTHPNAQMLANTANTYWRYDPNRPTKQVCVYHDSGEGEHFHIQVHPNTIMNH